MQQNRSELKDEMVYGMHPVQEAIDSGKQVERLFIQRDLSRTSLKELVKKAKVAGIQFDLVPLPKLNRLTRKNHQGVICFLSLIEYADLGTVVQSCFDRGEDPMILILDRITDVRNFGGICRTAECMGVTAVLIPEKGSAMINSESIRASSGALYNIPVCRSLNLKDSISYLRDSGLRIISCTEKGEGLLNNTSLKGPVALIMGSEGEGVSGEYLKLSDEKIRIPMFGKTGSLNVSVAAGMLLYEINRQKKS